MRITVRVKSRSSKTLLEKIKDGVYLVSVKESPEGGKANKELIKALANHFKIPQSKINIKTGRSSKIKIIDIKK